MDALAEAETHAAHQDGVIASLRRKLQKHRNNNNSSRSPSRDASLSTVRDPAADENRQRVVELEAELDRLAGERDALKRRVAALTQERDELLDEQETDEAEKKSLRTALDQVERRLKAVEAERDPLRTQLQSLVANQPSPGSRGSSGGPAGGVKRR